jgi:hypothetical protein
MRHRDSISEHTSKVSKKISIYHRVGENTYDTTMLDSLHDHLYPTVDIP